MKWTDEEIKGLKNFRKSINPRTNKFYTLREIGEIFNLTRERIRQLIGNTGYGNPSKVIMRKCEYRGNDFPTKNRRRRFCGKNCVYKWLCKIKEKPMRLYNTEERRAYNKIRNDKTKEYRREYYKVDKNRIHKKELNKIYWHKLHPNAKYRNK